MNAILDDHRFTSAQATSAAGISPGSLGTWLKRGDLAFAADNQSELRQPGTGRSRRFSARCVLHIALTGELTRLGLLARHASLLALGFTDHNRNDRCSCDDSPGFPAHKNRLPAEVFPEGGTVFRVMLPNDGSPPVASVERLRDIQIAPFVLDCNFRRAVLIVDLDDLHRRVWEALGLFE